MRASLSRAALVLSFSGLVSVASSQGAPVPEVRGGTGATAIDTVLHVTYDVASGRLGAVQARSAGSLGFGSPPCFDNSEIKLPIDPEYFAQAGILPPAELSLTLTNALRVRMGF